MTSALEAARSYKLTPMLSWWELMLQTITLGLLGELGQPAFELTLVSVTSTLAPGFFLRPALLYLFLLRSVL